MLPPSFAKQSVSGTVFQSVFWLFSFSELTGASNYPHLVVQGRNCHFNKKIL